MIYETYSERHQLKPRDGDIYQYEEVPPKLRVQIQQILQDALGPHYFLGDCVTHTPEHNPEIWEFISKTLCREFGVHALASGTTEGQP